MEKNNDASDLNKWLEIMLSLMTNRGSSTPNIANGNNAIDANIKCLIPLSNS